MHFGGYEVSSTREESSIIVIPVPYDETSTYGRGADKGPDAIMKASPNLEYYDIETGYDVRRNGIFTVPPVTEKRSPQLLAEAVQHEVAEVIEAGKFPVVVGGNHSVSVGAIRAAASAYSGLSVLQLDAHSDLRPEYENSELNHACVMARAREIAHIVQVGIRSMSADELPLADWNNIYPSHKLRYDKSLYSKALDSLHNDVYVTIDLDVFDPSLMPSTGTPEPGGPDYLELMHFLHKVARARNVVGFDVVELCPSDSNKMPDFVAARVIYQFLCYIWSSRNS